MIVVDYIRKLVTTIWLRRKCSFYIYKFVIYFKDGKCRYKGITYHRGETWTDGCDYDCECVDGHTGRYSCTNRCRIYFGLPDHCSLIQKSKECCKQPQCSINQHTRTIASSFSGSGSISGHGIEQSREATLPPCVNNNPNCHLYGIEFCSNFLTWSADYCRQYCNLCNKCIFNGKNFSQGDKWLDGCDTECVCEDARYGYYRCISICPTYSTLPSGCRLMKTTGDCCQSITCETGYLQNSSMNTISGNTSSVQNVTQLYITTTAQTTTQPNPLTQCIDSTYIKCSDSHVCKDTYLRRLCPVTCKLCDRCLDIAHCTNINDGHSSDISNMNMHVFYLKLFAVQTTTPPCVDVTYIDCDDGHVCSDAYLRQKCPMTCGICG
ncbi:unnamed protein product [Mytilus edulis]|uniref:VWFC domain-containing protein n=1 Tax=Mytilus edulis TaxID=6550 RepID=A0A8S3UL69_MYTED|nr:unnamed protein product [Mytilus edulis]